jgi:hypothetical protein
MARMRSSSGGSFYSCPSNPEHGSTYSMPDGRFYCAHHGHESLAEQHAGGPRLASNNWFTMIDMERAQGLTRDEHGFVVRAEGYGLTFVEEDAEEAPVSDPVCRDCGGALPPKGPGRPPVRCNECRK